MRRRRVLALLGAGGVSLAGCADSTPDDSDGGTPTPERTPTEEPTETEPSPTEHGTVTPDEPDRLRSESFSTVELDGEPFAAMRVGEPPESVDLRHEVDFVSQPTDGEGATFTVRMWNGGDDSLSVRTDHTGHPLPAPNYESNGADEDGRLLVGSRDRWSPGRTEEDEGCPASEYAVVLEAPELSTYGPGEEASDRYEARNRLRNRTCWPGGVHRFEQTYALDAYDAPHTVYTWAFELVIPHPERTISIDVRNATDAAVTVELRVIGDDEVGFEDAVELAADESAHVEPGIYRRGEYELTATVGEREATYPFAVDGYDLEAGSNLIVEVREEGVDVMTEE